MSYPSSGDRQRLGSKGADPWQNRLAPVSARFNREYRGESFDVPPEVEAMPIFRQWTTGELQAKKMSPFWEIARPQKKQHCLDIGCGVSFLIYPWRDWNAYFYGQEIAKVAQEALNSRGSQLNSKLYKGVKAGGAHRLQYDDNGFDLAIATGFSCYYPIDYWRDVIAEVKRVLKPKGRFAFDVLDPETELAEDWAILETYLGTDVAIESLSDWEKLIQESGGKIANTRPGELFKLYEVKF